MRKIYMLLIILAGLSVYAYAEGGIKDHSAGNHIIITKAGVVQNKVSYEKGFDSDMSGLAASAEYGYLFNNLLIGAGAEFQYLSGFDYSHGRNKYIIPSVNARYLIADYFFLGTSLSCRFIAESDKYISEHKYNYTSDEPDMWVNGHLGFLIPYRETLLIIEGRGGYNLTNNEWDESYFHEDIKRGYDYALYFGTVFRFGGEEKVESASRDKGDLRDDETDASFCIGVIYNFFEFTKDYDKRTESEGLSLSISNSYYNLISFGISFGIFNANNSTGNNADGESWDIIARYIKGNAGLNIFLMDKRFGFSPYIGLGYTVLEVDDEYRDSDTQDEGGTIDHSTVLFFGGMKLIVRAYENIFITPFIEYTSINPDYNDTYTDPPTEFIYTGVGVSFLL